MRAREPLGFTVVEIIVAMALTLAVFAITLPFVRAQTNALGTSAGRLDADQIARYAQRAIDRDLRLAAADPGQPLLVWAGPMAIAFNANLVASDTLDPGAAEVVDGAPTTLAESWRLSAASALPLTTTTYPTRDHLDAAGAISRNETVQYFLRADTISGRNDIYVLYRRVNARDSVQVVRNLHVPADSAFFSYSRPVAGALTRIAASRLPLGWDSTVVDSVRAVGIRAAGYYRDRTTGRETIRTVQWTTVIPNAKDRVAGGCGAAPAAPTSVTVSKQSSSTGYYIRVTWWSSTDDTGGESDVSHYLIRTRAEGDSTWESVGGIPARRVTSYRFDHHFPLRLGAVKYGVVAVDCAGPSAIASHSSTLTLP